MLDHDVQGRLPLEVLGIHDAATLDQGLDDLLGLGPVKRGPAVFNVLETKKTTEFNLILSLLNLHIEV